MASWQLKSHINIHHHQQRRTHDQMTVLCYNIYLFYIHNIGQAAFNNWNSACHIYIYIYIFITIYIYIILYDSSFLIASSRSFSPLSSIISSNKKHQSLLMLNCISWTYVVWFHDHKSQLNISLNTVVKACKFSDWPWIKSTVNIWELIKYNGRICRCHYSIILSTINSYI